MHILGPWGALGAGDPAQSGDTGLHSLWDSEFCDPGHGGHLQAQGEKR